MEKAGKVFVSSGEMSGDMHLSYIIEEIKRQEPDIEFHGAVGDKSIDAGAIKISHIKDNDIMGFIEALKKYGYFKERAREYLEYISKNDIGTVIFVDFGGFNLRFFELIRKSLPEVRTIYYIPPKVWAWGKKRIRKLARFDDIIVIFPFEKEYFDSKVKETGMEVKYFGNPLVDKYSFSESLGNEILLMPGSRKQEILSFMPEIIRLIQDKSMLQEKFIIRFADKSHLSYIKDIDLGKINNLEISFAPIGELRDRCKYAIATSGTVTFELSLTGLPVIVVYRTSKVNAFIARRLVKLKYISLTNLSAEREIFPELLQENFTADKLLTECIRMEKNKENILLQLKDERQRLGNEGVLKRIASYLINEINKNTRRNRYGKEKGRITQ